MRLRRAHIDRRGHRLDIERDALGAIHGLLAGLAEHGGDRLADMAHHPARKRKAGRFGRGTSIVRSDDPERTHGLDPVRPHVVSGEHGNDARPGHGSGCINPANSRMCMRRAHEHAVQGTGSSDVGHEAPAAEQEGAILDAAQRRPDALMRGIYCNSSRTRSSRSNADLSVTMNRSASPPFA